LLKVKLKSLRAWPALLIPFTPAERSLVSVTEIEPALVVKAALAETALFPEPLAPVKVISVAAAG